MGGRGGRGERARAGGKPAGCLWHAAVVIELADIQAAADRIADVVVHTPTLPSPGLTELLGVPVTLALGWALPWFGVTLLGFLVVDLVLGLLARRRRRPLPVSPAPAGS